MATKKQMANKKWVENRSQQGLACLVLWVQMCWLEQEIKKMRDKAGKQKISSMQGAFFFGRADGLMAAHKQIDREFKAFNRKNMHAWIVRMHAQLIGRLAKAKPRKKLVPLRRIKAHDIGSGCP